MRNQLLCSLFLCFLLHPFLCHGSPTQVNVGVILDLASTTGKTTLASINMSLSDYYAQRRNFSSRLVLHVRDSGGDILTASSQAIELIKSTKVNAILGPQTADASPYLAALCTKHQIPILSLSLSLSATSTIAESSAIAAFVSTFRWKSTVLIHSPTSSPTHSLISSLATLNIHLAHIVTVDPSITDGQITAHLRQLESLPNRVFIVHVAPATLASRLFSNIKVAGMMGRTYTWILASELAGSIGSELDPDLLQGAVGIRPWVPKTARLKDFKKRFRRENQGLEPGTSDLHAYDTAYALAAAVESWKDRPSSSLLDSILKTELDGMSSGSFKLLDGPTEFEAVNVVGEKERTVGKWTAEDGFVLFAAIVWPGESTAVPKGWEKKLRIGVPGKVEPGFRSFLWVERDNRTGHVTASGFVMEVFKAAVAELGYALPFEYVAFVDAEGRTAGDYNDLVHQVYLEKYDAAVGDITITSNRSSYVDFTQPYTVSGVTMVVPVRNHQSQNTWIFLKPLTKDLWLVSGAFFMFTGTVVWLLEHRINEEFRGPPANQLGTVFYFSFSTLVFAHTENVVSNLSRFVVIVWVFVVLILTSSYTASLTSMLTVQQLQPAVAEIGDLIKKGDYVGYLADSFVKGLLLNLGFDKSRLRPYRSPQQYAEALSKGSNNGGVSAIVDEIPYLRVFLKDYCGNYTMAGPTYKTGGLGFAFPKGSSLASDMSTAILKVTEGYKMREIEDRWFGDQNSCNSDGSSATSSSLGISSFWGLFLITGAASALSLFLFFVSFLYEHRHALNRASGSESSVWRRLSAIAKSFDQRDLSFHTFRRSESKDGSMASTREPGRSSFAHDLECRASISSHTHEDGSTCSATPSNFVSGR